MSQPVRAILPRRGEFAAGRVFDACLNAAWVGSRMSGLEPRDDCDVRLTPVSGANGSAKKARTACVKYFPPIP